MTNGSEHNQSQLLDVNKTEGFATSAPAISTIGHSTHSIEQFIALLYCNQINVVADVRSTPFSRYTPQFNREALKASLCSAEIGYEFLGRELGGRPSDSWCYVDGKVSYERLSQTELFQSGIEQLLVCINAGQRVALMCSEGDPLACHRTVLIAQELEAGGLPVSHITSDGGCELHERLMLTLLKRFHMPTVSLLQSMEDLIREALTKQGKRIAYSLPHPTNNRERNAISAPKESRTL